MSKLWGAVHPGAAAPKKSRRAGVFVRSYGIIRESPAMKTELSYFCYIFGKTSFSVSSDGGFVASETTTKVIIETVIPGT